MNELEERVELLYRSLLATRDHLDRQQRRLEELRARLNENRQQDAPLRVSAASAWPWLKTASYAAAFAVVLLLTVAVPWRRVIARPALKPAQFGKPPALAASPASTADDENYSDVLSLVYSFIPPGTRRSVQEMLGPDAAISFADSPWVFVNVDKHTTLVSFKPDAEDEESDTAYEFVVDRLARTVSASAETMLNLRTLASLKRS